MLLSKKWLVVKAARAISIALGITVLFLVMNMMSIDLMEHVNLPFRYGFLEISHLSHYALAMFLKNICVPLVISLVGTILVFRHGWRGRKIYRHVAFWYFGYLVFSIGAILLAAKDLGVVNNRDLLSIIVGVAGCPLLTIIVTIGVVEVVYRQITDVGGFRRKVAIITWIPLQIAAFFIVDKLYFHTMHVFSGNGCYMWIPVHITPYFMFTIPILVFVIISWILVFFNEYGFNRFWEKYRVLFIVYYLAIIVSTSLVLLEDYGWCPIRLNPGLYAAIASSVFPLIVTVLMSVPLAIVRQHWVNNDKESMSIVKED